MYNDVKCPSPCGHCCARGSVYMWSDLDFSDEAQARAEVLHRRLGRRGYARWGPGADCPLRVTVNTSSKARHPPGCFLTRDLRPDVCLDFLCDRAQEELEKQKADRCVAS